MQIKTDSMGNSVLIDDDGREIGRYPHRQFAEQIANMMLLSRTPTIIKTPERDRPQGQVEQSGPAITAPKEWSIPDLSRVGNAPEPMPIRLAPMQRGVSEQELPIQMKEREIPDLSGVRALPTAAESAQRSMGAPASLNFAVREGSPMSTPFEQFARTGKSGQPQQGPEVAGPIEASGLSPAEYRARLKDHRAARAMGIDPNRIHVNPDEVVQDKEWRENGPPPTTYDEMSTAQADKIIAGAGKWAEGADRRAATPEAKAIQVSQEESVPKKLPSVHAGGLTDEEIDDILDTPLPKGKPVKSQAVPTIGPKELTAMDQAIYPRRR